MEKYLELYLNFLKNEYYFDEFAEEYDEDTEEKINKIKKEIIENPNKEYGLAYTTDSIFGCTEFQVNINFLKKQIMYYVNDEIVEIKNFSEEEFLSELNNLDYNDLMLYSLEYEEKLEQEYKNTGDVK